MLSTQTIWNMEAETTYSNSMNHIILGLKINKLDVNECYNQKCLTLVEIILILMLISIMIPIIITVPSEFFLYL